MENDKLVRLSDVIETVENQCSYGNMWGNENLTLIDASKTIDELSDLPAVDVRENVKGEWISPDGISICSNCGKAAPYDVEGDIIMYWPNLNFCPNCGARMDGEDGDI